VGREPGTRLKPIDMSTWTYPGFPTDLQAQYMALMTQADGDSVISEYVHENRFQHVRELAKMGGTIKVEGRLHAMVQAPCRLRGTEVQIPDIRSGAALVIAALCAEAVGIIAALNEATLNHLKTRKQFGVPIGRFQALQHRMADMFIAAEQARSMAIIAAVFLGIGFTLGIYREPLQRSAGLVLAKMGIGSSRADFDTVNAVFQKGEYPAAMRLAQPLADDGDARAQSIVGQIHYRGRGVPQSDTEAAKWFRRAGDQGDALAQFYLGVMYNEGRGVPQDYAEAAKWYRLAAEQGDAQAQYNLGLSYARGEGVTPDPVAAHMWLNLAAAHFPASDNRGRMAATKNRDSVASEMTSDQLVEAQRRAREWKPKTSQVSASDG